MSLQAPLSLAAVKAPINFLRPMEGRPTAYYCEPPPGVPARTDVYAPHLVSVRNARPIAGNLSLDYEGFILAEAPTGFSAFADDGAIRQEYYAETEQQIAAVTGAARVIVFDHNIRNAARAAMGEPGFREPVSRAHNDFTVRSGPDRARGELTSRGLDADQLLRGRFAIINLWRPIGQPVEKWPLALCDASTVEPEDLVQSDLIYKDRIGEIYSLAFNRAQRWYYLPRLAPCEAILIKGYDSAARSAARFAPHTAFHDPTGAADAPERESIEVRALVLYPE